MIEVLNSSKIKSFKKKIPIVKTKKTIIIDIDLLESIKFMSHEYGMTTNKLINKVLKEYIDNTLNNKL